MKIRNKLFVFFTSLMFIAVLSMSWISSNALFTEIKNNKISSVGKAAENRHQILLIQLMSAQQDTQHLIERLTIFCLKNDQSLQLKRSCLVQRLSVAMKQNHANGIILRQQGQQLDLEVGEILNKKISNKDFLKNQLAVFQARGSSNIAHPFYVMASNQEFGIEMFVEYSLDAIQNIFNPRNDLGKSGEVFLASNKGLFITKQMYHCGDGDLCGTKNVISTNPMTACLQNNNNQMLDLDYRGVKIIHGFRYVPEIGGGCIMAHINQVEAFAPLNALQKKILTIAVALLFVFVILIYIFTSTITNPLLRLKDIVETSGNDNINSLIKRKDEIGHLANAFNKLILSQTESRETLEQHQQTIFESSKLNAMGEMARGVAHEINSPLAAVMLGAELIEYKNAKTPEPNKDITKLAKSIMEAGARISIIVKGLKGISRDATADTEETFTIRHLLDSTLSLCGQMLIANNIELIIEEGQLDVRLHGKETLLSQCLLNLITNAFEAVQVLDKKWIKLDVLIVDETIELRISDSGTGISSEIRKLMFRPMYTTKPIGSGPGLGLSMSRSIITNFGGNIIYDEENDHTCFIMKWPYS